MPMSSYLQQALFFIKQQHEWLVYLQSVLVEKEHKYKILYNKLKYQLKKEIKSERSEGYKHKKNQSYEGDYPDNVVELSDATNSSSDDVSETTKTYLEHVRYQEKSFVVMTDQEKFDDEMNHEQKSPERTLRKQMRNVFKTRRNINKRSENKSFSCTHCRKRFAKKANLTQHMRMHTGEKPYNCKICSEKFAYATSYKRHMMRHTGANSWNYRINRHLTDDDAKASDSNNFFDNVDKAIKEITGENKNFNKDENKVKQEILLNENCESEFAHEEESAEQTLKERVKSETSYKTSDTSSKKNGYLGEHETVQSDEKPFSCTICHKCFARRDTLIQHMRSHTGEKPYKCKICPEKFAYATSFKRHMTRHTGEISWNFRIKSNLTQDTVHNGGKPYSCRYCSMKFAEMTSLTSHIRKHETVKLGKKPFSCSYCHKCFARKSNLTQHIRMHTGEKPYNCTICSEKFAYATSYNRHMMRHTGEKKLLNPTIVCPEA